MSQIDNQTLLVLIGLALNFVTVLLGGITVLFSVWRWLTGLQITMSERLARVETEVKNLRRVRTADYPKVD